MKRSRWTYVGITFENTRVEGVALDCENLGEAYRAISRIHSRPWTSYRRLTIYEDNDVAATHSRESEDAKPRVVMRPGSVISLPKIEGPKPAPVVKTMGPEPAPVVVVPTVVVTKRPEDKVISTFMGYKIKQG